VNVPLCNVKLVKANRDTCVMHFQMQICNTSLDSYIINTDNIIE